MIDHKEENQKKGWLTKLKVGLGRSSLFLTNSLNDLLVKQEVNTETLEELEDILITADLGVNTASKISSTLAKHRFAKPVVLADIQHVIVDEIKDILTPVAKPLSLDKNLQPHVILVCGVNGSGKTTTVGKLAYKLTNDGNHALLVAADTFRAAATNQLKVWGERASCQVISAETGSDPAGLVFDAFERAKKENVDALLIDTAGRLQNKTELMEELKKIIRVLKKIDDSAPHSCLLVLDATVGQNAHSQLDIFAEMVNVTGLILTKIDGSAKGGVLVSLAQKFDLPVHAIGVGEELNDLQAFNAEDFASSLVGLDI